MESNHDIFISHSSADSKLAYAICHYLEERGIRCWIAPRDVQGGMEYAESIINGIRSCKIMVVLFNENANNSLFVKNEVERAFNYKSIIIPFKVDDTIPSATLELFLGSVHWLDAIKGKAEDYFDLLYQNCARSLGKVLIDKDENQTKIQATTKNKFIESDIVGYYELDSQEIDLGGLIIKYNNRRYEFFESGSFINTYRCNFVASSKTDRTNLNIEFEESFLCEDIGNWKLEDNHLILSRINSIHNPNPEQEIIKNIFEKNSDFLNLEEISKIVSHQNDNFKTEDLGEFKEINNYKRLNPLSKRMDSQENLNWLKAIEEKAADRIADLAMGNFEDLIANTEVYLGGHIQNLDDYIDAVVTSFENDYSCVHFNGDIPYFKEVGWSPLNSDLISCFNLPKKLEKNIILLSHYKFENSNKTSRILIASALAGPFAGVVAGLSKKTQSIEVYFGAFPIGYIHEKQSKENLKDTSNFYLEANLLLLKIDTECWVFSLSCWINDYRDIPCISSIELNGNVLNINCYKQLSNEETEDLTYEINLNKRINRVIVNLWNEINSNSSI